MSKAIEDIARERCRQIEAEGWTPQADDNRYHGGELAAAGTCYAMHAAHELSPDAIDFDIDPDEEAPAEWPFHASWWKPRSPREDLVRAGALIAAEIERMDRAAKTRSG